MVLKERPSTRSSGKSTVPASRPDWKVPKGGDIREVTRNATKQVIREYNEALRKLRDH